MGKHTTRIKVILCQMYVIEIELKLQPLYHFLNNSFLDTNSISNF